MPAGYRDLVAILAERGLPISHTTILRWVVHYADTCEKRWRPERDRLLDAARRREIDIIPSGTYRFRDQRARLE